MLSVFVQSIGMSPATPTPATAPTIDWEVDTGILRKVAIVTKSPPQSRAASAASGERGTVTIPFPTVLATAPPCRTAPAIAKTATRVIPTLKRINPAPSEATDLLYVLLNLVVVAQRVLDHPRDRLVALRRQIADLAQIVLDLFGNLWPREKDQIGRVLGLVRDSIEGLEQVDIVLSIGRQKRTSVHLSLYLEADQIGTTLELVNVLRFLFELPVAVEVVAYHLRVLGNRLPNHPTEAFDLGDHVVLSSVSEEHGIISQDGRLSRSESSRPPIPVDRLHGPLFLLAGEFSSIETTGFPRQTSRWSI